MKNQAPSQLHEYKQCRSRLVEAWQGLRRLEKERSKLTKRASRKGILRLTAKPTEVVARLAEIQHIESSLKNMTDLLRVDAWLAREKCLAVGESVPERIAAEGPGFEGVPRAELLVLKAELKAVVDGDVQHLDH